MIYGLNWWVVLALVLPMFFLASTIHEGSHGLFAKYFGWGVSGFYPWPKKYDGRWYFALILMDKNVELEPKQEAKIWIAPRVANLLFVAISCLGYYLVPNVVVKTLFGVLGFAMLVDCFVGTLPIYLKERSYTDVWRFHHKIGWKLLQTRVASGVFFFVLAAFVLFPFGRV